MSTGVDSETQSFNLEVGLGPSQTPMCYIPPLQSPRILPSVTVLRKVFGSAIVGALAAMIILLAGTWAGLHSADFRTSGLVSWVEALAFTPGQIFVVLVVIAVIMIGGHYHAAELERKAGIDELKARSHTLAETLRTLPPESFLSVYPEVYATAIEGYEGSIRFDTAESARRAVRLILRSISYLAESFDRPITPRTYSAAAFLYCREKQLGGLRDWPENVDWIYQPKFLPRNFSGGLVLDPRLSTTSHSDRAEPMSVAPVILPIAEPDRDHPTASMPLGRLRVLPGAATAFVTQQLQIYADTHQIRRSIQEKHSLEEISDRLLRETLHRGEW